MALLLCVPLAAQNAEKPAPETERMGIEVQVDSMLLGRDIFSVLSDNVTVQQDASVRKALSDMTEANADRMANGFRIRIYSSSSRGARDESLATMERFNRQYPYVQVYRSYAAPNFKVTVGNFRNRAEAEAVHRLIKDEFPGAFIVRDRFRYPTIGKADMTNIREEER